nr:TPA_asm: ND4L [Crypturopus inflatus]
MVIFYVEASIWLGLAAGLCSFILNNRHFLTSLLSLEYMVVLIYWGASVVIFKEADFFFSLFYLTVVVCEGALGLSLLISATYSHGSDFMKMYNSLNC